MDCSALFQFLFNVLAEEPLSVGKTATQKPSFESAFQFHLSLPLAPGDKILLSADQNMLLLVITAKKMIWNIFLLCFLFCFFAVVSKTLF